MLFAFFSNSALARLLPFAEGTILAIHILGWFAILISMIVVGPHHSNEEVWSTFLNLGGYESSGVSFLSARSVRSSHSLGAVSRIGRGAKADLPQLTPLRTALLICPKKSLIRGPQYPGL